jgi:predicted phosphodiesterase
LDGGYFLPEHTVDIHERNMKDMTDNWNFDKKHLVVSHHLPSYQSVTPGFRDHLLNPAYASDLDNWIIQHKPDVWIHGHSHIPVDYMIEGTRIISNPRGYVGYEPNVDPNYNYKVVEI